MHQCNRSEFFIDNLAQVIFKRVKFSTVDRPNVDLMTQYANFWSSDREPQLNI